MWCFLLLAHQLFITSNEALVLYHLLVLRLLQAGYGGRERCFHMQFLQEILVCVLKTSFLIIETCCLVFPLFMCFHFVMV